MGKHKKKKEYALYDGDTILAVGTVEEIAKARGLATNTLYRLKSISSPGGMELVDIEEDDDDGN